MKFTLNPSEAQKVFRPLEEATALALKDVRKISEFVKNWGMTPETARTFFKTEVYPAIDEAIAMERNQRRF